MRIPDWLVYAVVFVVVVTTTLFVREERPAREPAAREIASGETTPITERITGNRALPAPHPLDEKVLVQVGDVESGVGTAFAINKSGVWITARHVVDGCADVGLVVGGNRVARVSDVRTSPDTDLALLFTNRAPHALRLDLDRELHVGDRGFHIGFPQGEAGEASSQLAGRSRLVTEGRYALDEPVLAWVETDRSPAVGETLSGMSGGPVLDADGAVVAVTVAESPRRQRIYAAGPESIRKLLDAHGLSAPGEDARPLAATSWESEADRLRKDMAIVKVVCRVDGP